MSSSFGLLPVFTRLQSIQFADTEVTCDDLRKIRLLFPSVKLKYICTDYKICSNALSTAIEFVREVEVKDPAFTANDLTQLVKIATLDQQRSEAMVVLLRGTAVTYEEAKEAVKGTKLLEVASVGPEHRNWTVP